LIDVVDCDSAEAVLAESAKVDRDQQRADYKRFEDLAARGFISGADLERRKAQLETEWGESVRGDPDKLPH
jgi:multidrug resistance efflux pump